MKIPLGSERCFECGHARALHSINGSECEIGDERSGMQRLIVATTRALFGVKFKPHPCGCKCFVESEGRNN